MTEPLLSDSKVLFRVPNADDSVEAETLWSTHLGGDKYKLDNSPFFAYNVSWDDVVFASFLKSEGHPTCQRVVEKSGIRTIRIFFDPPVETDNQSDGVLQGLVLLGCSYEGANRKYISLNIPPSVVLDSVRNYLIENNATWEHADPTDACLYPKDA